METLASPAPLAQSAFPLVAVLDSSTPIEIKADAYGPMTLWNIAGVSIQGFPTLTLVSPVSGNTYTISYLPRRGYYGCSCQAGQRIKSRPLHDCEPLCWHLYEFNREWLPRIMAERRGKRQAPRRTGILTAAEREADFRQSFEESLPGEDGEGESES